MKTIILFSSFFYLLGLKLGNTVEIVRKVVMPVSAILSAPADKPDEKGKSYHFESSKPDTEKKEAEKAVPAETKEATEADTPTVSPDKK